MLWRRRSKTEIIKAEISILKLKPGDVLIVKTPDVDIKTNREIAGAWEIAIKNAFGGSVKCIICSDTSDFNVLRKD